MSLDIQICDNVKAFWFICVSHEELSTFRIYSIGLVSGLVLLLVISSLCWSSLVLTFYVILACCCIYALSSKVAKISFFTFSLFCHWSWMFVIGSMIPKHITLEWHSFWSHTGQNIKCSTPRKWHSFFFGGWLLSMSMHFICSFSPSYSSFLTQSSYSDWSRQKGWYGTRELVHPFWRLMLGPMLF